MATYLCRGRRIGWPGGSFNFRHPNGELAASANLDPLTPAQAEAFKNQLVAGDQAAKAAAMTFDDLTRERCGASLDEIVAAAPADGELRSFACPKCGNPFKAGNPPAEG